MNIERERQFLSTVMRSVENIKLAKQYRVGDEFFGKLETKTVFSAIIYQYDKYHDVVKEDTFKLLAMRSKKLTQEQKNEVVNEFIAILNTNPVSNFETELDDFIEAYKLDYLQTTVNKAIKDIKSLDGENALNSLKTGLNQLEKKISRELSTSGYFGDEDVLAEYADKKLHPEKYIGVQIGIQDFDNATNGLLKGTVTLIMGQMKSAKSVLMVNMANYMFSSGKKIYYHVNEGGYALVRDRLISCATGLNYSKIRRCELTPQEETIFADHLARVKASKRLFIDSVGPVQSTATFIENRIRELGVPDVILVDYLNLMQTDDKTIKSSWEKIGAITIELKNLAMKYQVPIVVLTHVNRQGMSSKGDSYELDEIGNSLESIKHVDTIASWRIVDPEQFKNTHIGNGVLAIQGARDSETPKITLYIDTHIMKITQLLGSYTPPTPIVEQPVLHENLKDGTPIQDFF